MENSSSSNNNNNNNNNNNDVVAVPMKIIIIIIIIITNHRTTEIDEVKAEVVMLPQVENQKMLYCRLNIHLNLFSQMIRKINLKLNQVKQIIVINTLNKMMYLLSKRKKRARNRHQLCRHRQQLKNRLHHQKNRNKVNNHNNRNIVYCKYTKMKEIIKKHLYFFYGNFTYFIQKDLYIIQYYFYFSFSFSLLV